MIRRDLQHWCNGREIGHVATLVLLTLGLAAWTLGLTEPGAWSRPMKYEDDSLEIMTRVQLAALDPSLPLRGYAPVANLGAPAGADWRAYRLSDGLVFAGVGLLARLIGVVPAWHVGILAGFLAAALAFYAVVRGLRWSPTLATGLGLVFALGTFNVRWAETLSLNFTFIIPPLLLLSAWLARPGGPRGSTRAWSVLALGLGAWMGMANPYYLYFGLPLVVGAVGLHLLARPHRARWRVAACFMGALALTFAIQHHGLWSGQESFRMDRDYAGTEVYGLKITDLVLPPVEHRWLWWSQHGAAYPDQSVLATEYYSNYLGFVAMAGLLVLAFITFGRLARRPALPLPGAALAAVWLLAVGTVGGLNSLAAYFGWDMFRAGNRAGVFLFALGLLAAGNLLHRIARGRSPVLSIGLAGAVTVIGLWDLVLPPRSFHAEEATRRLQTDEELARFIETRQTEPPQVFQFPATAFPEAPSIGGMHDYEHFRPWLTRPRWRFSYGALRGSAGSRWLRGVARLPPEKLAHILPAHGFDTVWIDRRAYPGGARMQVGAWVKAGAQPVNVPRKEIAWLRLPPQPAGPTAFTDFAGLAEPWLSPGPTSTGLWLGAEGWYDYARTSEPPRGRWARDRAAIAIYQPHHAPLTVLLSFRVAAISGGELTLRHDDHVLWRGKLDSTPQPVRDLVVELPSGVSRLHFEFEGRIRAPHRSGDTRALGFRVSQLSFTAPDHPESRPERRWRPRRAD